MLHKKFNLLLVGVLFIIVFFNLPAYNAWLTNKILGARGDNLQYQFSHLDLNDRKVSRWGYPYMVFMKMAKTIGDDKNAKIIMPPNDLLKAMKVKQFKTPEPAEFYYYTGLESVQANSPKGLADSANWELMVKNDEQIMLRRVPSKQHLDSLLTFYRKFQEP